MNHWYYSGEIFTEEHINDHFGFVYLIENKLSGRKYIGKKFFTKSGRKQIKGKTKKVRLSSGWENYWSSSEELKTDVKTFGEDKFTRTILYLCKTKSELSYMETKEIFLRDALLTENYYNKWISVRINARNLNSLRD